MKDTLCDGCGKPLLEEELHPAAPSVLCDSCRIHQGLFPLGHTGPYRTSFSVKDHPGAGRTTRVTVPRKTTDGPVPLKRQKISS